MRRVFKWIGIGLLGLLLAAVLLGLHTWYGKPLRIEWFYTRVFTQFLLDDPELLSRLRILDGIGLRGHNAKLSDASLERAQRLSAKLGEDYAMLKSYDASGFTGQDRLSYDILVHFLGRQVDGERFRFHNFPVNQMFGIQSGLPNFMAQIHQIKDQRDAENYIARLRQFPRKFDQTLEQLAKRDELGIVPPEFLVTKVLKQMRDFVEAGVDANVLVTSFVEKLGKIPEAEMDQATRDRLLAEVKTVVESDVFPAYGKLIGHFEGLAPRALRNDGAWAMPDGKAYYEHQVRSNTTTDMSADEIHALGLAEVARIGAEMDEILRGQGLVEGSVGARVRQLAESPEQLYPDTVEGRNAILKDYMRIIAEINRGIDDWFAVKPKASVQVLRVPEFSQLTAPGAYYEAPALDGSRPGTFFANLRDVGEIPKFGMRTLAYHEAVPGHHFQIAIAQELKGLPIFRRMLPFTAYAEGWALYSERVAWEAGFQKDPLDNLGRLQAEQFRAVRLVVDTGMHAKGWTREQAIEYMILHTGMGRGEVTAEIERYLVWPGQALAYKVGMEKMLELRQRARDALGDDFDIREFHDVVLKNGSMPLAILERVVDEWIASKRAPAAA
jgi:uncharacterized protein (DUF885 family)